MVVSIRRFAILEESCHGLDGFFFVVYIIVCFMHVSVVVWLDSIVYVAV